MNRGLEQRVRSTAPSSVPALDHGALQRRGGRRRRARHARRGGLAAVAGVAVALAVVPGGTWPGSGPAPTLGGGPAEAPQAETWPAGEHDGLGYRLLPAERADEVAGAGAAAAGCDLLLDVQLASGTSDHAWLCDLPGRFETMYQRVTVGVGSGEAREVTVVMAGGWSGADTVQLDLEDGARLRLPLDDLSGLEDGPNLRFAIAGFDLGPVNGMSSD